MCFLTHGSLGFLQGFNDTERSDADIFLEIQQWLKTTFGGSRLLSAILYFHRISETPFQGSSRRGLNLFKQLRGQENKNVLLVSTFWNQVPGETCFMREKELIEMTEAWKTLIDGGAKVERMGQLYGRFVPILGELVNVIKGATCGNPRDHRLDVYFCRG